MLQVYPKKRDRILSARKEENGLLIRTERGLLGIEPWREDIVRIRYTRKEAFEDRTGIGICRENRYTDWYAEGLEEAGKRDTLCLVTPKLRLSVSLSDAAITYQDSSGRLLLAERPKDPRELEEFDSMRIADDGEARVEEVKTADGVKKVVREARREFDKKLYHTRLHLSFQEKECLYGLGQAEEGVLNLRGTTQYLHQANRKIAVPFLLSTMGYGLLWATGSPAVFQDTQYGSYFYTEADPEMDYYFIAGECADQVIAGYRYLTGKAALLPRWAYGFIQSQERYETQKEILEVAEEYRSRGIGLDCLVLDWCSWEGNLWGQKTFDRERFPDVSALTDRLHKQGIHFMVSIWPNMSEECDNYRQFKENGLLLPASNIYNAFSPQARELYWQQLEEGIFRYGTDAWWCDSSEPYTPEWERAERPEPADMYEEYVKTASLHMPAEYSNAYGLVHAQGVYEGQTKSGSKKRVTNLTRNGYTGQQRYGTILWSGDIGASWDTLRRQIAAGLNFCASGLPYWTLDIGAFFVKRGMPWYWDGEYEDGMENRGYQELFVRWFQLGAFLPVFRSHGTDVRRELWMLSGPDNCFYEAALAANRLRYRLMPYIYSLAGAVWREDATMMRMLAFDFPADEKACLVRDQFLFGRSLMVCPVTEPMYFDESSRPLEGVCRTRSVYLPGGTDWYDFYTNERYAGGQTITARAPISRIPLYVRSGSILPTAAGNGDTDNRKKETVLTSVAEALDGAVMLSIYPGTDAVFDFYEDEGDGYGYERGEYCVTRMKWDDAAQKTEIGEPVSPAGYRGKKREYKIYVVSDVCDDRKGKMVYNQDRK